jgi:hypothetical protein
LNWARRWAADNTIEEQAMDEFGAELLAETENYMVWTSEVDGENLYHVELGGVSVHLTEEDWEELITLMTMIISE